MLALDGTIHQTSCTEVSARSLLLNNIYVVLFIKGRIVLSV